MTTFAARESRHARERKAPITSPAHLLASQAPAQASLQRAPCACGGSCPHCTAEREHSVSLTPNDSLHRPAEEPSVPLTARAPEPSQILLRSCACGGGCSRCRALTEELSGEDTGLGPEAHQRRGLRRAIQPKLVIGSIDDPLEHEADRIADQLMQTSENGGPPSASGKGSAAVRHHERVRPEALQGYGRGQATFERRTSPPVVDEVLAQSGRPLDSATRAFFEAGLGLDLGHVRIHDDALAAASARAVGARAYTVGSHIAFSDKLNGARGRDHRLLAHELVHVVQQTGQAAAHVARQQAPPTPSGASAVLARAADTIAEHRRRALAAVDRSGLRAVDIARIRRNLATCSTGEEKLRRVAQAGDDAASAAVLAVFTSDGMRKVIPRLTRVSPVPQAVAVNEIDDGKLAAYRVGGPDVYRPVEREAERVAALLVQGNVPREREQINAVLHRYLDPQAAQQIEQTLAPAAPAIVGGAAATAAAIVTAPLWVWVVAAVVVVAIVVAVGIWVYSDDDASESPDPQMARQPVSRPQPKQEVASHPVPQPRTIPRECVEQAERLSNRGCGRFEAKVMGSDLRNPQADEYCHDITGNDCEFWLYPAVGGRALAKFDGIRGGDVIECKCGYDSIIRDLDSTNDYKRRIANNKLFGEDGLIKQILSHLRYTRDCGLQYRIIVSSEALADFIRDTIGSQVDVIVQPSELCD